MSLVAVALGSNLGDRGLALDTAVSRLRHLLPDLRVSSYHETEPVDVDPQPLFLNAAAVGSSAASPAVLLKAIGCARRSKPQRRPCCWKNGDWT